MEKYYFKVNSNGECLTICEFRDDLTKVGSSECKKCKYNKEYDSFYNFIRCKFYSVYAHNYVIYGKLKNIQKEVQQLSEENVILQHRINELEGFVSDLKGTEV